MDDDVKDRFIGCFLGLAAGDALGMPAEGFTGPEIRLRFGHLKDMLPSPEGHFHCGLKAGQFTDDTEETLVLAESIIEAHGFSGDHFAEKLMKWGEGWTKDQQLNRGVGFTTRTSIEKMLSGISWKESGIDLPTCGSAMRAAPIGLLYHCDLGLVCRYADLQSISTHCSPAARAGSIALAAGVALAVKGFAKTTILKMAAQMSRQADMEFAERLLWIGSLLHLDSDECLAAIGSSPLVWETVPAAFYCFLKFDPEEGLIKAASSGGDTDSIASMAGALYGALFGTVWIPERWLSCLEGREHLETTASHLADLSSELCSS